MNVLSEERKHEARIERILNEYKERQKAQEFRDIKFKDAMTIHKSHIKGTYVQFKQAIKYYNEMQRQKRLDRIWYIVTQKNSK